MIRTFLTAVTAATLSTAASAAFVIEIDTDGLDDGVLTFSPNFSFGGDTTSASQSSAPSQTPGVVGIGTGDSIFGGNGTVTDDYVYSYTPGVDGDNAPFAAGSFLNTPPRADTTSGLLAGSTGDYDIYGIWPFTTNSLGPVTFTLSSASETLFTTVVNQNTAGGNVATDWVLIGSAALDADTTYTLTQSAPQSFVSQRAHSVMFEATSIIPEPASAVLALGGLGLLAGRRRR